MIIYCDLVIHVFFWVNDYLASLTLHPLGEETHSTVDEAESGLLPYL